MSAAVIKPRGREVIKAKPRKLPRSVVLTKPPPRFDERRCIPISWKSNSR